MPRQESHLFIYPQKESVAQQLPEAVYIKLPGFGSIPCKIERMDEQEIAALHEKPLATP